jgi:hypothetical protein
MHNITSGSPGTNVDEATPPPVPACFKGIVGFDGGSLDRKLGYFGSAPFVVFSFHPMAGEVIWNDGRSTGFGGGGWRVFLSDCAPAARRVGAQLGSQNGIGSEVLLVDRTTGNTYAVARECAEEFLARVNGRPPPAHRCLCGMKATPCKE